MFKWFWTIFSLGAPEHWYVNLCFNCTVQNTNVMRKLLGLKFNVTNIYMSTWVWLYDSEYYITYTLYMKSYSLFPAKVYFLIKWRVDDSPHWLQVDWVQTDRRFEVPLFKPTPLGYLFVLFAYTQVVRYALQLTFHSYSLPRRKRAHYCYIN